MFSVEWPSFWKGRVRISCRGEGIPSFLNQAMRSKISIEDITWVTDQHLEMTVCVSDFFQVVKLIRQSSLTMRIQKKSGVPFWWNRVKRKKFFHLGVFCFLLLLFTMSSFIWKIDIQGTENIPKEQIRSVLREEGLDVGTFKYRLPDQELLKQRLQAKIPESAWIGLEIEGTRVLVTIVEKKQVEKIQEDLPSYGPVHLIAKKEALVKDLRVERGNPLVGVHDVVQKGDILVSGIYGENQEDSENQEHTTRKVVGAKGKVWGEVWYQAEVEVPIIQNKHEYTGLRQKAIYPFFGSLLIRHPFQKPEYQKYETVQRIHPIIFGRWKLPIGWMEEEYLQMKRTRHKLTKQDAILLGKGRAVADLRQTLGEDGKILTQKVLHQRLENGKVYLKIHFDVIENIAIPKPIIQGE